MKNNLYTEEMKKIKAPDSLIDKTVKCMRSADNEDVVAVMNKPKSKVRIFKFTSAIAAVLAVVIGFGAIHFAGENDERLFVLTANAAELTSEAYVEIGKLENVTSGSHYRIDEMIMTDDGEMIVKKSTPLSVTQEFNLAVTCSGEDIESVTYTVNNGYLTCDPSYEGLLSFTELTNEDQEKYGAWSSNDDYKLASSCTFGYNNQPASRLEFEVPEDGVDGSFPLRAAFTIFNDNNEYVTSDDKSDEDLLFYQMFNDHADEFSIDITVNYSDGLSSTQTLTFRCELTESENRTLMAKIA